MAHAKRVPEATLNVLVLGMHRSGTSAVAGALYAAGLSSGEGAQLVGSQAENPLGFAERPDVVGLNDRLLQSLGWAWDTPDAEPPADPPARAGLVDEGRELVAARLGGHEPWAFKDPRASVLLPWWRQILLDRFVVVVAVREPSEVAWSLALRDGYPAELGLAIWAAYHRHLAAGLAGLPVIVVDYAALTAEPARLVPELLAALGRLGVRGDLDAAAAVTAIEPLLRRATEPAAGGQPPSSALDVELRKQWLGGDLRVVERFAAAQLAPAQAWEKAVLALRRAAHAAEERAVALKDEVGTARAHAAAVDVERAAYGRNMNRLQAQLEEARKSAANSARQVTELEAARTALLRERDRFRQQVGIAGAQSVRADGRSPRGVVRSARRRLLRGLVRVTPPTVLSYAWHNPLFDAAWYREHQRDVNVRKMNPERHFRRHGAREGRNPNEMFQVAWYLAHYPDVAQRRMNPLDHYLLFGAAEGRNPGPAFNTNWYLAQNPDVVRSGLNPLLHYMSYGKAEHRLPKPTQMALPAATVGQPVAIPTAGKSGGNGREAAQPSPAVPMPPLPRVRLAEPTLQVVTTIGDRLFKLIAFYLPQFHPIPENDEWWGKGFTEWTHVKASRPLYEGHPQPRLPTELGFYDLREPEVRERQAALARRYGVSAFCYYYYWFDGRRVLERPLNEVLASGKPDFPFLICWANENWTRRWDGLDQDVLLRQNYSADSSRRFIREVIPILADPRYVRYDGKPVLVIYRVSDIPDIRRTVQIWRDECRESGLGEIHLAGVRFWDTIDVAPFGFDGAVDFPPHHAAIRKVDHQLPGLVEDFGGLAYDYETVVRENLRKNEALSQSLVHRGLMLAWDSTPRRGKTAHFAHGATPELYQKWLSGIIDQDLRNGRGNESLVFINAWNEWGEGANLEPDSHFGSGFLDATKAALDAAAQSSPATSSGARRK